MLSARSILIMETRNCQNCRKDFVIDENDFSYYQKIGVLAPKICPDCRSQARLIFRNERFFYKRPCDNCKKDTISVYSANKPVPVWCNDCWWSDDLDPASYGLEYDPSKPFLSQFAELIKKTPRPAIIGANNVNSQYVNLAADNKDCYMIIESSNNENCVNCYWIQQSKDLIDCSYTNKVELSYEVDDCNDSSFLIFSKGCYGCLDSAFLLSCRNCTDCLGCINLVSQKYCIFNRQYSKEEYEDKLKSYRLDTHSGLESFKKEFNEFIKDKPRKFAEITNAVNSSGNYLMNVRNNKECFHAYEAEDNAYSVHVWRGAKDCMDCNTAGRGAELIYNTINTGLQASNVICGFHCWGSQFMEYCFNCPNAKNCLGCSSYIKGSYAILNKKYSKEEYEKLRAQIVEELKIEGIYGDFFPKEMTSLGYNESSAIDEFPLTKEEVLKQGFNWEDSERGIYGKETVNWESFPDSIFDFPSNFDTFKEVFACETCKKNYRVTENEISLHKKIGVPISRICPDCRHISRIKRRGPNKVWDRECMCSVGSHGHGSDCTNKFKTSYSPESQENVYCEDCYNKEVY